MIQVTCACGAIMQVQDENAGKQCKCPKCSAICQIGAAAAPVEAAPAPTPAAAAAAPVSGARPGGLTALAVLNFVFGGFGIIGGLWRLLAGAASGSSNDFFDAATRFSRSAAERSGNPDAIEAMNRFAPKIVSYSGAFYFLGILGLVLAAFLIVAGVGYLKQSKKAGWLFGNIYGITGIILAILTFALLPWVLSFFAIFDLAYAIVTLALLNTVFKINFTNP